MKSDQPRPATTPTIICYPGGPGTAPSVTITGNPWRIVGGISGHGNDADWIVFENGQRISREMLRAIKEGRAKW